MVWLKTLADPLEYIHWLEPTGPDISTPYENANWDAPNKIVSAADTT